MKTMMLTNNRCYSQPQVIAPKGIMVHSTGCNQPKVSAYVQSWNSADKSVCVHAFVGLMPDGSVDTVQTLPWCRRAWHCGVGTSGRSANSTHIAFEICEDDLTDAAYFNKCYNKAVELCAYLCKEFDLDPMTDIICHCEGYQQGIASNHADVMHWFPKFGKSMDTFRKDVYDRMKPASEWSKEARAWAVENGIVTGYGNGNYGWRDKLTREQMAVMLYRFYKLLKG